MPDLMGITREGLDAAMSIKDSYRNQQLVCMPGQKTRLLIPEYLMNRDLNLSNLEDPLPLAMMASRDPETPMALAAVTRLSPIANNSKLVTGIYTVLGETTRHPLVRKCVELVTKSAFNPDTIASVSRQASRIIIKTREEYTLALRQNLHGLLDGSVASREFVKEFFQLTEAGNLRNDIRKKLVVSLLLSENIPPSTKFLMLEHFERLPEPVRLAIISAVLKAEPTRQTEMIKEELKFVVVRERTAREEIAAAAAAAAAASKAAHFPMH